MTPTSESCPRIRLVGGDLLRTAAPRRTPCGDGGGNLLGGTAPRRTPCGDGGGDLLRSAAPRRTPCGHGYTLIELLVVLALIGLATSVVLPAFFRWTSGAEARADENLVLTELGGLGFRAWSSGQAFVLDDEHARDVLRRLPASWQAHIEPPIVFASSGACSGGRIAFVDGAGSRRAFRLAPLTCDVQRE